MQSRKNSLIEACVNTIIGCLITIVASPPIYYICDVKINGGQITTAAILFTIISLIRGYVLRRLFNYGFLKFLVKVKLKLYESIKFIRRK